MVDWGEVREQFPITKRVAYLNAAEGSPIPKLAAREAKRFYDEALAEGEAAWGRWLERLEEVREKTAKFINAGKDEIAFTLNTSHGMNLIAGMLVGEGGVVTMEDEFPSSTLPWLNKGFKVKFVKPRNNVYDLESIGRALSGEAKILVTSHVQYATGFKQDLAGLGELCESRGLTYVVNATQSAGAMPIDVKEARVDFLVFSGLKWLMAGHGVGVLYVNKKWHGKLKYPFAGWRSVKDPGSMDNKNLDFKPSALALEAGCPHFPNIFALGGALDLLNAVGKGNVEKRIYELGDRLVEGLAELRLSVLSPLEREHRSGITLVKVRNPAGMVKELSKRGAVVSARGGGLRASVHIYNNERDVDRLVEELGRLL